MKICFWGILFSFIIQFAFSEIIVVSQYGDGKFKTIQEAVNAATPGTVIQVRSGTYYGPIVMREHISLQGIDMPVIDGNYSGAVVTLASNTYISGFQIIHSGSETGINDCGILAKNVKNTVIFNNELMYNGHYGIIINKAECRIHYNKIANNDVLGIYITDSSQYDIGYNIVINHIHSAIDMECSGTSGRIYNNYFARNKYGIYSGYSEAAFPDVYFYNNIFKLNETALNVPISYMDNLFFNCFQLDPLDNRHWCDDSKKNPNRTNIFRDPLNITEDLVADGLSKKSPCINKGSNGYQIGPWIYRTGKERNVAKKIKWSDIKAKYRIQMYGIAINNTANNKTADFSCIVYSEDGIHFHLKGQYDNRTLFGYTEMCGIKKSDANDPGFKIEFTEGTVYLGSDNSGYPEDFILPHTGTLEIGSKYIRGTYKCGTNEPYQSEEQFGNYYLVIQSISDTFKTN